MGARSAQVYGPAHEAGDRPAGTGVGMNDVEMIRDGFAAFGRGDLDAVAATMSPDVVWHAPGRSDLAGDYRGPDAVLGYLGQLFERSDGTFRAELRECGEIAPGLVACRVRISGQMRGGAVEQDLVQLYRREDGRTVEVRNYHSDQYQLDEALEDSPAAIVRRGYDAFAAGDLETLRGLFSPDVVWTENGRSELAGTYRGVDATLGLFVKLFERTGGTFRAELLGCGEIAPGLVAAMARDTATLPHGEYEGTNVHTFRVEGGRVVEVRSHPSDAYAFDAAMGVTISLPDARSAGQESPVRA